MSFEILNNKGAGKLKGNTRLPQKFCNTVYTSVKIERKSLQILGTIAKLRKATVSFVIVFLSVCLSVHPHEITRLQMPGFW